MGALLELSKLTDRLSEFASQRSVWTLVLGTRVAS